MGGMRRLLLLALATATLAGCAAGGAGAEPSPSPTLSVHGTLRVEQDIAANVRAGQTTQNGPCTVEPGYDDQKGGTRVVVRSDGDVVGIGSLKDWGLNLPAGETDLTSAWCEFTFRVGNVPAGLDFYTVQIGDRDEYAVTENELGDLDLTLGDVPGA